MSPGATQVLRALRRAGAVTYGSPRDGWRMVYLDGCRPAGMSLTSFNTYLSKLSKLGLYQKVDGVVGMVKRADIYE